MCVSRRPSFTEYMFSIYIYIYYIYSCVSKWPCCSWYWAAKHRFERASMRWEQDRGMGYVDSYVCMCMYVCIYIYMYIFMILGVYTCVYIYICHMYKERTWVRGTGSGLLRNLLVQTGNNSTGSLFCSYINLNLRKSPETSGSLRDNVIEESCTPDIYVYIYIYIYIYTCARSLAAHRGGSKMLSRRT